MNLLFSAVFIQKCFYYRVLLLQPVEFELSVLLTSDVLLQCTVPVRAWNWAKNGLQIPDGFGGHNGN